MLSDSDTVFVVTLDSFRPFARTFRNRGDPMAAALQQIPVAQYLRMSTGLQEYSLDNQSQAIDRYAKSHGFCVVRTYSDPAKSGMLLRKRKGLQRLIQDVVQGQAAYKAILVYDVTRWGRFLDTDESAHYEFLCKSAGVRVHYCAETFPNDDTMPSMIMKSLKRAMAGEFSRELGVKVFAGQTRGAILGFRQGARPGYGLRRLLVSADGTPKLLLARGDRKSLSSERTILVPGPAAEVRCVRKIYEMFIQEQMSFAAIARALNRQRTGFVEGSEWNPSAVQRILTHLKYVGCNTYGCTTRRLYTPEKRKPRSEWSLAPGAFEPLVDLSVHEKAQVLIEQRKSELPRNRSDRDLLNALRNILVRNGRISSELIKQTPKTPSTITYRKRFGTLGHAYELVGYKGFWDNGWIQTRRRIQVLRDHLIENLTNLEARVSIEKCGGRRGRSRSCLRTHDGQLISVIASRPRYCYKGAVRWFLKPVGDECRMTALVARLNLECDGFKDMFVISPIGSRAVYLKDNDPMLQRGIRLAELREFWEAFGEIEKRG
jgi:DNA invertase Pin-like site-specific DNA recombinase